VKLDAVLRDVAVGEQDLGRGFAAEQDVELRETEAERVVLVDERDANLVRNLVGQARRKLQPAEAGTEDHDVRAHARGRP
jgi:phytoene/squalene synthetase